MVTVRAITSRGQSIDWNYDSPQQASRVWKALCEGRTPDTGESITRAYYFGPKNKPGMGPDKAWHA